MKQNCMRKGGIMRLHYKGKYNLDPKSLPKNEHMPGAVKFKEVEDSAQLGALANKLALVITLVLAVPAVARCFPYRDHLSLQLLLGSALSVLSLFPHELLHAICFKEDVYLYTNLAQGMLFVVGPEQMSKGRFLFMSMLPNIVFGIIPYIVALIFPQLIFLAVFGALSVGAGAGDYYNVYNTLTQVPKGGRVYMYEFNSYWYVPKRT